MPIELASNQHPTTNRNYFQTFAVCPLMGCSSVSSSSATTTSQSKSTSSTFHSRLCQMFLQRVECAQTTDYSSVVASIQRANPEKLRDVFHKYASFQDQRGERFMTSDDFVRKFIGLYQYDNFNEDTVNMIASAADTNKDGLISFDEFLAFEHVLCSPDALYLTAFEMFDTNGSESITFDEFQKMIKLTCSVQNVEFDFKSDFIRMYFGRDKQRALSYAEFCQLLHDFHFEQCLQAFRKYDKQLQGYITAADFKLIMSEVRPHMLSSFVHDNLLSVAGGSATHMVSFPWFLAFNDLLTKIEVFKRIYLTTAKANLQYEMTREEYLHASQSYGQVTPLEVNILFQLADLRHPNHGLINFEDLERIDPERLKRVSYITRLTNIKAVQNPDERSIFIQLLESAYRFTLGSVAGACGATAVYPIDLVKTRMQNQRSGSYIGELMYKNSFDCFKKVVRHEGLLGLYRGLIPQLVGVAPEKAIKLTTNDLVRDKLTFHGHLPLWGEIVAGGCGGASQVMFTNPLEIVKIRLQVAGEIQTGPRVNVFSVLKDLGFIGLYKGAKACFLRDIPFSAIYFPSYAHGKLLLADENGHNNPLSLFCAAFAAGVPAAGLVTPADVIKTRLQVAARAGQTTYDGVIDCYRKIMQEEGFKALWKGAGARVFRSSPQFGVTLLVYELLQRMIYVDFGGTRPAGSEVPVHKSISDERSENPDHIGGYKLCQATLASIESKFGLYLPKFSPGSTSTVAGLTRTFLVNTAPTAAVSQ